jgi:hypothetical protein
MHHHDTHAEVVQDRDLLDQRARLRRVAEHGATGFHDEDLALEQADVRRRRAQCADHGGLVGAMRNHAGQSLSKRWRMAICTVSRL